ncbi:toll/interleukin-1 receptor domain-containing protein [Nocardia fluminea]|uniref:toll/interleukin-1 receptor domain-containing protein n=1 Tax=Nocardia fluminea TaxID=134984 RepID=UPI00367121DD
MTARWDFFISYANDADDRRWAEWIAYALEDEGYSCRLQAWDSTAARNFVLMIDEYLRDCADLIIVLSPGYLSGRSWVDAEWSAKFVEDPDGKAQKLIPIMVRPCTPTGLLGPRNYVPIHGCTENDARLAILDAVRRDRGKPSSPPPFPGTHP